MMPTNLNLDDNLLEQAKLIGKHKTKKAAVTEALQEYIQRRKQIEITNAFGSIEYDAAYDYKQQRRKS
jgi:Arc/MetJ family transcription regulator